MTIRYSHGYGETCNKPTQREAADFAAFCDDVLDLRSTAKRQHFVCGPCGIAPDDDAHRAEPAKRRAIGKHHRCKTCVESTAFLGLDVDGWHPGDASPAESATGLCDYMQRYDCLIYSTASSTPTEPRLRVLVALDMAAPRAERIAASRAFRARVDAHMRAAGFRLPKWDDSCDKPEQPLYTPTRGAHV